MRAGVREGMKGGHQVYEWYYHCPVSPWLCQLLLTRGVREEIMVEKDGEWPRIKALARGPSPGLGLVLHHLPEACSEIPKQEGQPLSPPRPRSPSGGSGLRKRVQREPEVELPGGRGSAPCRQASGAFTVVSKGVMAGSWPGRRGREWEALLVGSSFGQVTGASGNRGVAGMSARFVRDERVSGMWDFSVFNVGMPVTPGRGPGLRYFWGLSPHAPEALLSEGMGSNHEGSPQPCGWPGHRGS